jgi:hypothetical protein
MKAYWSTIDRREDGNWKIRGNRNVTPAPPARDEIANNRSKRPAVLEVSAHKLEALKRALARGLGKRRLRHLEFLGRAVSPIFSRSTYSLQSERAHKKKACYS